MQYFTHFIILNKHDKHRFTSYASYRIPQDTTILNRWEQSIKSHAPSPLRGMVCINHFCEDDLIPATKSRPIALRKDAVPTIFESGKENVVSDMGNTVDVTGATAATGINHENNEASDSNEADSIDNNPNVCSNETCQYLRIRNEDLCKEILIERINNDIQVKKLEKQVNDLKTTIHEQSDHIKRLDMRTKRTKEAKIKLDHVLKELQQQNLLREDAADILEVRFIFEFLKILRKRLSLNIASVAFLTINFRHCRFEKKLR